MPFPQEASSLQTSRSGKTLLVVEDDEGTRLFLEQAIQQETAYRAITVATCHQAVEVIQACIPNLLILDYYLPPSTGIALYDHLHTFDGLGNVPALILTASFEKHRHEIEQHHLIGLAKPVDLDELLQTIDTLLKEVERV